MKANGRRAWRKWAKRMGAGRGGFCYGELVLFLGREPTTWQPRQSTERGTVVLSLMLLGALAGVCISLLTVLPGDHPPPQRPYPIEAGNDPDPPADPPALARLRQRECMNEYRRQHRKAQ